MTAASRYLTMIMNLWRYVALDHNFTEYRHLEYRRRLKLVYWISILGAMAIIPYSVVVFYQNSPWQGLLDLLAAATLVLNALAARWFKLHRANIWVGLLCIMGLFAYTFTTGGINQSGFIWYFILPPLAAFLLGSKPGLVVSLLMLIPVAVLFQVESLSPTLASYGTDIAIRFPVAYLVVVYFSYLFERDHENNCDALGELRKELEKRVADRTYALTLANAKLVREMDERQQLQARVLRSEKMEAIGNLVGGVAHDLNNILSGLVSYPDVLLSTLPEDSGLRKPMLTIRKSGERAAAIVQDMLYMARGGVMAPQPVNLNEIVSEYLNSLELDELLKHHPGVRIDTALASDLLATNGAPGHLSKIVMNLVINAVEATESDGTVRLVTENRHLDTMVNRYDHIEEGEYVTLIVSDSGSGISTNDLTRIFEPFFTRKTLGRSGTGLGLAVVWSMLKDLRGFIDVESFEGHGTTFKLYFPVTREAPAVNTPSRLDLKGFGETLLIVDDIAEQREIARSIFEALGYRVQTASNGREALVLFEQTKVDLVILDMSLDSDLDGLGTYRELFKLDPGLKTIIVSGFAPNERVREMQQLGAGQFVQKPYMLETIGTAVRNALDGVT